MTPVEILVVGAGPSGLTLACALRARGVPCRIVDAAAGPTRRSRAIGVAPRSLEVLQSLGVAQDLVERTTINRYAKFYSEGAPLAEVTCTLPHLRFPYMLTTPQSVTEGLLVDRLAELGGTVERRVRVASVRTHADHAEATLVHDDGREETVRPSWLVGADGRESTVRAGAGIPVTALGTRHRFVIVDVEGPGQPPGTGHYYFSRNGMVLTTALSPGVYRVAATVGPDVSGRSMTLDDVTAILRARGCRDLVPERLSDAGWGVSVVTTGTRIADRFRAGRVVLAGDAAHVFNPLGGPGMNTAIQDAHALAWRLAALGADPGDETLIERYARERRGVALAAHEAVDAQAAMATMTSRPRRMLRDALLRVTSRLGLLEKRLIPGLTGVDIVYPPDDVPAGWGHRGERVPDVALEPAAGGTGTAVATALHDILDPVAPTVLLLGGAGPALVGAAPGEPVRVLLRPGHEPPGDAPAWVDPEGALHEHFGGAREPGVVVLRPDGHVVYAGPWRDDGPTRLAAARSAVRPRAAHATASAAR